MALGNIFGQKCVRCGDARTKKEFEGLPTCEKCELEIKAEREEKRPCPACHHDMDKTVVLNVIVDRCPKCRGAWLDSGELDLLKQAIQSGTDDNFAAGMLLGMGM